MSWSVEARGQRGRMVRVVALATSLSLAVGMVMATGASAKTVTGRNGVKLTVTSSTVRGSDEVRITVKGSGYSTTRNNRFGIYLSFGEKPYEPRSRDAWAQDMSRYLDKGDGRGTKWVHPGTATSANQAVLRSDGTFSTKLSVKRSFTGATASGIRAARRVHWACSPMRPTAPRPPGTPRASAPATASTRSSS